MASAPDTRRFDLAFEEPYRAVGRVLGIRPGTAWIEVGPDRVEARFGPWRVATTRDNVVEATVSGPYSVPKTLGPAHLSFTDRGLTFATNATLGVCLRFRDPVRGIEPFGLLRHPGLTVTVADPDGLVDALSDAAIERSAVDEEREEQAAVDQLHTMTASELRSLAADRGLSHPASLKKAELVALLEADLGDDLVDELPAP